MGKIRNRTVKNVAKKILRMYPTKISTDFEKNKTEIQQIAQIYSKKLRNQIAGYLVTLHKISSRPKRVRVRRTEEKKPRDTSRSRGRGRGSGRSRR